MEELYFTARTTADTAELYWDKPEGAEVSCEYEVFLDGTRVAATERTHFTLTALQPEHSYRAEIRLNEKQIGDLIFETKKVLRRLDVTKEPYLAKGDGTTMNTAALQRAFNDCGAEEEVYFPVGIYLTGALDLHSNMAVYLDEGAVLQGSEAPEDYLPRIWSRFEGVEQECYRSLLNVGKLDHTAGPNCRNILLYGKGTISGGGRDPDSSENCTLFATRFETHDDSVAIKSGKNPEGNEINRSTRHIRVFDCYSVCGHGICIGSEMSGGVEDVKIWDCDVAASYSGIEIKGTPQRGGYVRNVSVRDCSFILDHNEETSIFYCR